MSLNKLRDEAELLALYMQEEFGMQETKAYAPNGSNYHDHRCSCPGCNYDGPDPTDAQIAEWEQESITINAWRDEVVYIATCPAPQPHSDARPFCSDPTCGCKTDMDLLLEHILRPFDAGLLTVEECQYIFHNVHI